MLIILLNISISARYVNCLLNIFVCARRVNRHIIMSEGLILILSNTDTPFGKSFGPVFFVGLMPHTIRIVSIFLIEDRWFQLPTK